MAEKSNRSVEIFEALKARIIRWEYPPGFRLTEDMLCGEFSVSRIPVREALHMLVENELLDRIPHRGCTVKQLNLAEINELYEVRTALELHSIEHLTRMGMPAAVRLELEENWRRLGQTGDLRTLDGEPLARQDEAFHEALVAAAGNQTLFSHLRLVDERLFFTRMSDITTRERLLTTCRQHLDILHQIAQGDVQGARTALQTNIDFGRHNVESALKDALARAYLKMA